MDLYKEILIEVLKNELVQISFPDLKINPTEIMEVVCYQALIVNPFSFRKGQVHIKGAH